MVEFKSVSANEAERIARQMSLSPGSLTLGDPGECTKHEGECPTTCVHAEWKFEEGCDNGLIGKDFRWLHCPVCGSEELCTVELGPTWEFIGCQCGWGEE